MSESPGPSAGAAPPAATDVWSFPTGGMVTALALSRGIVLAGSTDGRVYALRASCRRTRSRGTPPGPR